MRSKDLDDEMDNSSISDGSDYTVRKLIKEEDKKFYKHTLTENLSNNEECINDYNDELSQI